MASDALANISDEHRECRDWSHSWTPFRAWKIKGGGWEEHRLCVNCNSTLIRLIDKQGYTVYRRIAYADGYVLKGLGRLSANDRAAIRLASVKAHETGQMAE